MNKYEHKELKTKVLALVFKQNAYVQFWSIFLKSSCLDKNAFRNEHLSYRYLHPVFYKVFSKLNYVCVEISHQFNKQFNNWDHQFNNCESAKTYQLVILHRKLSIFMKK